MPVFFVAFLTARKYLKKAGICRPFFDLFCQFFNQFVHLDSCGKR